MHLVLRPTTLLSNAPRPPSGRHALTPLNDSFLDFGTLASIDPVTHEITDTGHYAAMVAGARRQRRSFDRNHIDWLVIRNRFSLRRLLHDGLDKLAMRLGFRPLDGCAERIVYRELFPTGLTAFDSLKEAILRTRPSRAHLAAQREVGVTLLRSRQKCVGMADQELFARISVRSSVPRTV